MNEQRYLAHHGIKGQKWGIRRFQNEDGSLTAEGEERYEDNNNIVINLQEIANKNSTFNPKTATRQQALTRMFQLNDEADDDMYKLYNDKTGMFDDDYLRHPKITKKVNRVTRLGIEAYKNLYPTKFADEQNKINRKLNNSGVKDSKRDNLNYKLLKNWFLNDSQNRYAKVATMIDRGVKAKDIEDLHIALKKYQSGDSNYFGDDSIIKFAYECEKIKNKKGNEK